MKNGTTLLSLLLIIALSFACKKKTVNLNEEFTLDFNKTATVKLDGENKLTIQFNKLVEDSRCPPGAYCFWAGQVAVRIKLDGTSESIIGFHSSYPSSIVYKDRKIRLLEVNYNKTENFSKENYCSIRLKVE
jgi:hypothetical protein